MIERPDREIDAYLEGELTAEQAPTLEAWINAAPDHAAEFLHLVQTHQALGIIGKENQLARQAAEVKPDQLDPVTLASLADMEAKAEQTPYPEFSPGLSFKETAQKDKGDAVLPLHAIDDLRWAAGKLSLRLIRSPLAAAVVAAVLLIGFLLIAPWDTADTSTTPNVPSALVEPESLASETAARTVATLTTTHNARWAKTASASPVSGDVLRAGQHLTLTQGSAEITTQRGAIAILEAPAMIELIDNDNAIHLHAGKLVGICETPSSKGFIVRTPHLHVTDLGTRFGVDLSDPGATEVHVLEGEVAVTHADAPGSHAPQRLLANESARATSDQSSLASISPDPSRFATMTQAPVRLPGTGNRLKVGETESNWHVVAINGSELKTHQPVHVLDEPKHQRDVPNNPGTSQWIGFEPPSKLTWGKSTSFLFRTRLEISDVCDLDSTGIMLRYAADNQLRSIRVNGHTIEVNHPIDTTFWTVRSVTLREHLIHGENVIDFEVLCKGGFVALNMQWELDSGMRPD